MKKIRKTEATPETTPFWKWLKENLFLRTFFDNQFFPQEVVLYSHQPSLPLTEHLLLLEEQFTREDLYEAVMKACGTHKRKREALWFHVNVIDQAVWTLQEHQKYGYPLPHSEKPLTTLFWRMEKYPADQAGTTYVGLLSDDKKWLLLIEQGVASQLPQEADFKIRFCGDESLGKTVRSYLKQSRDN